MDRFILTIVFILTCSMEPGVIQGSEVEFKLMKNILENYDTAIRPVTRISDAVNFSMDFSLNQLITLREKEQDVQLNMWMRWYWTDVNLAWNMTEYDGITHIFVQPNRIWLPDITLYNSISAKDGGVPNHYNAKVRHDGFVTFLFPSFVEASCKIDVTYFPFDTQRCVLTFGSWGYPGNKLDIRSVYDEASTITFIQNGVWDLVEIPVTREVNYYICCPEPYPLLKYTIVFKRLPLYYVFNLLMPCIVITVLNLLTFLIPVESGEKIALNITVLLTMMVFLLIVAEIMPPQSEVVPVIGRYFGACIFLLGCSTVATVLVLHLHFRGTRRREVPYVLKKYLFGRLGRLLVYGDTLQTTNFLKCTKVSDVKSPNGEEKPHEENQTYLPERKKCELTQEIIDQEWKVVAMIVDRLFFILHALGTLGISIYTCIYM